MYTYKAQKEKTMELSKKREKGGAASTASSDTLQHWSAVDATTCEHLASRAGVSDLLFRGSCKRIVPQKKNSQIFPDRQLCGDNKVGGRGKETPGCQGDWPQGLTLSVASPATVPWPWATQVEPGTRLPCVHG